MIKVKMKVIKMRQCRNTVEIEKVLQRERGILRSMLNDLEVIQWASRHDYRKEGLDTALGTSKLLYMR